MSQRHRIATLVLLSSTALASPAPHGAPPPDNKVKKELLDLRAEAMQAGIADVKAHLKHYKPMCDADGYPLVGNVAVKGEATQPSEVCKLIRERPASRSW